MLLVNDRRQVRSVSDRYVRVPYVREHFRHDRTRVRAFLAGCQHDSAFIRALMSELTRCLASVPAALPHPRGLIDAGERAIAHGLIGVGRALPQSVSVTFDSEHPSERFRFDAVVFPNMTLTADFLAGILDVAENRAAFEAALDHPASRRYVHITSASDRTELGMRVPAAAAAVLRRATPLLVRRYLALLPDDPWRRQLRLVWIEHAAPATVDVTAAAPARSPPPPAPPPPAASAPMSVLPSPPAEQSPQAQTLVKAAENGTPFCEECARQASELAGA